MTERTTIAALKPDPNNARKHTKKNLTMIADSLRDVGTGRSIVIDEHDVILAGNGVIEAAQSVGIENVRVIEADGDEIIAVKRTNLTDEQKTRLALFDNRTAELAEWNSDAILKIAGDGIRLDDIFENLDTSKLFADHEREQFKQQIESERIEISPFVTNTFQKAMDDERVAVAIRRETKKQDKILTEAVEKQQNVIELDEYIFPSNNEWGVPSLDPTMEATKIIAPFAQYATISKKGALMYGTYHFYTNDFLFAEIWDRPDYLVMSECKAAVEPNYSAMPGMRRAEVLWGIYRKRWLARYWQENGIQMIVDLYTAPEFDDLALLGVPRGWRFYATRGVGGVDGFDNVLQRADLARQHAGTDDITFLVYAGSKHVESLCYDHGFMYMPDQQYKDSDGGYALNRAMTNQMKEWNGIPIEKTEKSEDDATIDTNASM